MDHTHKDVVVDMISRSFADKGDLTTLAQVTYDTLYDQVVILWERLLSANLSFVILDKSKSEEAQIIGACLNFDARSEEAEPLCACAAFSRQGMAEEDMLNDNGHPKDDGEGINEKNDDDKLSASSEDEGVAEMEGESKPPVTTAVVEFLQAVEEPLKDEYLPKALGKTVYTSLLGTSPSLTPGENVKVIFQ